MQRGRFGLGVSFLWVKWVWDVSLFDVPSLVVFAVSFVAIDIVSLLNNAAHCRMTK